MDELGSRLVLYAAKMQEFDFNDSDWDISYYETDLCNSEESFSTYSEDDTCNPWLSSTSITENVNKTTSTSTNKKPLLVELHSFPGYFDDGPTPLPANIDTMFIFNIVTNAQHDLDYKSLYKETFLKFFESKGSSYVLQDIFWWFFCHKYQPNKDVESKIFKRVCFNYTCLMFGWLNNKYCNTLFKNYADLIAQSVYSIFCHAFPTSYRQFNSSFRDELIDITSLWILGTKPAPRAWKMWNFSDLEPRDLRKGEKIQEEAARGSKGFEIDFEQVEELAQINRRTSRRLSITPLKMNRRQSIAGNQSKMGFGNVSSKGTFPNRSSLNVPEMSELPSSKDDQNSKLKIQNSTGGKTNEKKMKVKENKSQEKSAKQTSSVLGLIDESKQNSCVIGDGPIFAKRLFNIFGRSPLISYFLIENNLLVQSNKPVFIKRTEISKLPSMSNETYQDVVKKVKNSSSKHKEKYDRVSKKLEKERRSNTTNWLDFDHRFEKASKKLLSSSQMVKNISDLIRATDKDAEDTEIRLSKLRHIIEHALDEH